MTHKGKKQLVAPLAFALGLNVAMPIAHGSDINSEQADAALDAHFSGLFSKDEPGCVYAVTSGGEIIAHDAGGLANMELNVPLAREMAFDIGSTSKQFTAASAAILARRGKLDLDADIRTYLPDMHPFDTPIRVRDLIYHSSGLPDVYEPLAWLYGDSDGNKYPSELTLKMARGITSLDFEPSSKYEYSNVGYLLLGEIVETVSGQSLRDFAEENIFGPLGMNNTHFHDDAREIVPSRASAYSQKADGTGWEWRHSDFTVMGDGGVYSTVGDLAKWYSVFDDPSKLDGGQALINQLLSPGEYNEEGPEYRGIQIKYGYAIQMFAHKGVEVIGHPGGWAGYASAPYYFPDGKFAVIACCTMR